MFRRFTAAIFLDSKAAHCFERSFAVQQAFCKVLLSLSRNATFSLPQTAQHLKNMLNATSLKSTHGTFTMLPNAARLALQLQPEDTEVLSLLLSDISPAAVQHIALEHITSHPHLRQQAALTGLINALATSNAATLDIRIQALEHVDYTVQFMSRDAIASLLQLCERSDKGPLREALMPLIASQIMVSILTFVWSQNLRVAYAVYRRRQKRASGFNLDISS